MVFGVVVVLHDNPTMQGPKSQVINLGGTMRSRSHSRLPQLMPLERHSLPNHLLLAGVLIALSSCTAVQERGTALVEPVPGPVRGFQIQILTTPEKTSAEMMVAEAQQWWDQLGDTEKQSLYGAASMPVEIKWLQPYYRVRMGHFRSPEEAQGILKEVAVQFPAAFVVPDTIE